MRTAVMSAPLLFRSVNAPVWRLATSQEQRFLSLVLLTAATFASGIASAGGLQVSPVTLSLTQAERAGIFTISNNSETPMNAQARVFKWTQTAEDEYVLEPTNDLLVSPPIMQYARKLLAQTNSNIASFLTSCLIRPLPSLSKTAPAKSKKA